MKKAFTLIELLVVIAIIAILAAMLMPALNRARIAAMSNNSRANLHSIGLAFAQIASENKDLWPGDVADHPNSWWDSAVEYAHDGDYYGTGEWIDIPPQPWVQDKGGPWFQLYSGGYIEGVDVFDDPGMRPSKKDTVRGLGYPHLKGADWSTASIPYPTIGHTPSDANRIISNVEYGYDVGRVHLKSDPARVVCATLLDIGIWDFLVSGTSEININYSEPYPGGSNVLFFDMAVVWAPKLHADDLWNRDNMDDGSGNFTFPSRGYVPNPRLDEDANYDPDDEDLLGDVDDIYAIECDSGQKPLGPTQRGEVPGYVVPKHHSGDVGAWTGPETGEVWPQYSAWRPNLNWKGCYRSGLWGGKGWGLQGAFNRSQSFCYEQRGPYAVEPRWNKFDSRIVALKEFFRGGGMGAPEGFDWQYTQAELE